MLVDNNLDIAFNKESYIILLEFPKNSLNQEIHMNINIRLCNLPSKIRNKKRYFILPISTLFAGIKQRLIACSTLIMIISLFPDLVLGITIEITVESANIRSGPSTQTDSIAYALQGEQYEVIDQVSNGWYRIQLENGRVGYISNSIVQILETEIEPIQEAYDRLITLIEERDFNAIGFSTDYVAMLDNLNVYLSTHHSLEMADLNEDGHPEICLVLNIVREDIATLRVSETYLGIYDEELSPIAFTLLDGEIFGEASIISIGKIFQTGTPEITIRIQGTDHLGNNIVIDHLFKIINNNLSLLMSITIRRDNFETCQIQNDPTSCRVYQSNWEATTNLINPYITINQKLYQASHETDINTGNLIYQNAQIYQWNQTHFEPVHSEMISQNINIGEYEEYAIISNNQGYQSVLHLLQEASHHNEDLNRINTPTLIENLSQLLDHWKIDQESMQSLNIKTLSRLFVLILLLPQENKQEMLANLGISSTMAIMELMNAIEQAQTRQALIWNDQVESAIQEVRELFPINEDTMENE